MPPTLTLSKEKKGFGNEKVSSLMAQTNFFSPQLPSKPRRKPSAADAAAQYNNVHGQIVIANAGNVNMEVLPDAITDHLPVTAHQSLSLVPPSLQKGVFGGCK